MKNILIKGNLKMGKHVYLYNLPPQKTCTPTQWCLKGRNGKPACYGLRNNFRLPSVVEAAEKRWDFSRQDDFVDEMIMAIRRVKVKYFRFHASGDFYNEAYIEKVYQIVLACSDTLFRTTTRRRDFKDAILKLNSLPNMVIRESLDVCRPEPEMGLSFTALDHMDIVKKELTFFCCNDCSKCNFHCWRYDDNIRFKEF